MSEFDILNPKTLIHSRYLLEASAGTGKTFSIENLFVRLILEKEPSLKRSLTVQEIVAVTFTNDATAELKKRIKAKISSVASEVELFLESQIFPSTPYLRKLLEEEDALELMHLLKTALFSMEEAQIFTIHSFCYKLLKEHYYKDKTPAILLDKTQTEKIVKEAIQDYFQSNLPGITPAQARLLMAHFGTEEKMKNALLHAVQSSKPIIAQSSTRESFEKVQQEHQKSHHLLDPFSAKERKDCLDILYRRRKAESFIKDKTIATCHLYKLVNQPHFSQQDFERLITDGVAFFSYYKTPYVKPPVKAHPMENTLLSYLEPLHKAIESARNPTNILALAASEIRELFFDKLEKSHQLTFDTLLKKTAFASKKKAFTACVRKQLKAAIIDEFQDTDPIQWSIFRNLFLEGTSQDFTPPYLYLVGDPKQSIYAFRSADIYTYLQAYKDLGKEAVKTLETNWRSSSALVEGINHLFSEKTAPKFLHLPLTGDAILCPPVKSGQGSLDFPCKSRKAIHFFCKDFQKERYKSATFESDYVAAALVEELVSLREKTIAWEQIAILAKDRTQLLEVKKWLNTAHIPYSDKAGRNAMSLSTIEEVLSLAKALASPRKISALKRTLAGPFFGFDEEKLKSLENPDFLAEVFKDFFDKRKKVDEQGFAKALYSLIRQVPIFGSQSPWERLHQSALCEEIREDLCYLIDLLLSKDFHCTSLDTAIETLQELYQNPPAVKIQRQKGVQLTTLHSSKGLEWDVVFSLAHLKAETLFDPLISVSKNGKSSMQAAEKGSKEENLYFQEKDAEKARLFYVLMTRAKHRLYIPLAYNFKQETNPGQKSMQELWLEAASAFTDPLQLFEHSSISHQFLYPSCIISKQYPKTDPQEVFPSHDLVFPPQKFTSFSSLTQDLVPHLSALQPPQDLDCQEKTIHTLPGGAALGTILHTVLENTSFDRSNLSAVVQEAISSSNFSGWETPIQEMVENALQADLGGFSFNNVDPSKVWKELEFCFSSDTSINKKIAQKDLIKGFIDLVFFHKGIWYIVDWKTNWLGPNHEWYSEEKLFQEMEKHDYFLQASLYKKAIANYLKQQGEPIKICCVYLFLRACVPGTQKGVYFVPQKEVL